jgi:hypothetical protein
VGCIKTDRIHCSPEGMCANLVCILFKMLN